MPSGSTICGPSSPCLGILAAGMALWIKLAVAWVVLLARCHGVHVRGLDSSNSIGQGGGGRTAIGGR
jgi:hypothetical protein